MTLTKKNKNVLALFMICLILLVQKSESQYEIPSYYGFWSKDFYKPENITSSNFTIFELHFPVDMNYESTKIYYADKIQHCIYEYELQTKIFSVIAGKCSKSGIKNYYILRK